MRAWIVVVAGAAGCVGADPSVGEPADTVASETVPDGTEPPVATEGFSATVVDPETLEPVPEGSEADLIWSGVQGFGHYWYGLVVTGSSGSVEIDPQFTRLSDGLRLIPDGSRGYFLLLSTGEEGSFAQNAGVAEIVTDVGTFEALDGQDVRFDADVSDLTTGDVTSVSIELTGSVSVE